MSKTTVCSRRSQNIIDSNAFSRAFQQLEKLMKEKVRNIENFGLWWKVGEKRVENGFDVEKNDFLRVERLRNIWLEVFNRLTKIIIVLKNFGEDIAEDMSPKFF